MIERHNQFYQIPGSHDGIVEQSMWNRIWFGCWFRLVLHFYVGPFRSMFSLLSSTLRLPVYVLMLWYLHSGFRTCNHSMILSSYFDGTDLLFFFLPAWLTQLSGILTTLFTIYWVLGNFGLFFILILPVDEPQFLSGCLLAGFPTVLEAIHDEVHVVVMLLSLLLSTIV